jgi:hypothetical protein
MNRDIEIECLTPLFSKGSYTHVPEIRAASIRGQLHGWFRALGGSFEDERAIFGGVSVERERSDKLPDQASRLVVRVSPPAEPQTEKSPLLPHKQGGQASFKHAFAPGTRFTLHLRERRDGLNADLAAKFDRPLQAWLLLGALGNRSTRGGGSLQPLGEDWPSARDAYEKEVERLLRGTKMRAAVLDEVFPNQEAARKVMTDTLGGQDKRQQGAGENDLKRIRDPLGKVHGKRKTSPLRLRLYRFDDGLRIVAVWDGRSKVTGNREGDLRQAIKLLDDKGKPIGRLLQPVAEALDPAGASPC